MTLHLILECCIVKYSWMAQKLLSWKKKAKQNTSDFCLMQCNLRKSDFVLLPLPPKCNALPHFWRFFSLPYSLRGLTPTTLASFSLRQYMTIDSRFSVSQIPHNLMLIHQKMSLSFRYVFSYKCLAHFSGFLMLSTSSRLGSDPALTISSFKNLTGFSRD